MSIYIKQHFVCCIPRQASQPLPPVYVVLKVLETLNYNKVVFCFPENVAVQVRRKLKLVWSQVVKYVQSQTVFFLAGFQVRVQVTCILLRELVRSVMLIALGSGVCVIHVSQNFVQNRKFQLGQLCLR